MLDVNASLNRIYTRLGLNSDYFFSKYGNPSVLKDLIDKMTLPVFSRYHPYTVSVQNIIFNSEDVAKQDNQNSTSMIYKFNDELEHITNGGRILFMSLFEQSGQYGSSVVGTGLASFGGFSINTGGGGLFDAVGMAATMTNNTNGNNPISARYVEPNMIQLVSKYHTLVGIGLDFRIHFEHNTSWATITEGLVNKFEDLAVLDLMIYLWDNELKYIDKTSLGNSGEIDLKINEFEEAKAKREEIISRYKRNKTIGSKRSLFKR